MFDPAFGQEKEGDAIAVRLREQESGSLTLSFRSGGNITSARFG